MQRFIIMILAKKEQQEYLYTGKYSSRFIFAPLVLVLVVSRQIKEWENFTVLYYFSLNKTSFGWIHDGVKPFEGADGWK